MRNTNGTLMNPDARYTRRPIPIALPENPGLTQKYADRLSEIPQDGYALIPAVCYLPYVYNSAALEGSTLVRKANLLRTHTLTAPSHPLYDTLYGGNSPGGVDLIIPAYETYNTQVQAVPGSIILGYRYWEYDYPTNKPNYKLPSNIMLRVSDACTGLDTAHDYFSARDLAEYQGNGVNNLNIAFCTSPRVIAGSGQLNVEIQNTTAAPLACQLLIFLAEPVTLVETPEYGTTQGFAR
jgi:hypothetical protein